MRRSTLECFFFFLFLPLIIRLASGCRTRVADVGPEGRRLHKSGPEKDDPASLLLLHLYHGLRPPRPQEAEPGPQNLMPVHFNGVAQPCTCTQEVFFLASGLLWLYATP